MPMSDIEGGGSPPRDDEPLLWMWAETDRPEGSMYEVLL